LSDLGDKLNSDIELTEEDFNFGTGNWIKGNPFKERLKKGYSVTVHYGPECISRDRSLDDIIEDNIDRIRDLIRDKVKGMPRGEKLDNKLDEIYQTLKNC